MATPTEQANVGQVTQPSAALFLEQALVACASQDSAENRQTLFRELLLSDVLLALADQAEQNTDGELKVAILTNTDNTHFAAAFTSQEAAQSWRPDGGNYVSIPGQDLFKLLKPSPAQVVVLNPGSTLYAVIGKEECEVLSNATIPSASRPSPVRAEPRLAFPPDVFNADQLKRIKEISNANETINALAVGAVLPPGGHPSTGWLRTLFIRVTDNEMKQENVQKFCTNLRDQIIAGSSEFKEAMFEVGVMNDKNFWISLQKDQPNNVVFDKNPPIPDSEKN